MILYEQHKFRDGVERAVYADGSELFIERHRIRCPVCFDYPPWDRPPKPLTDTCPDCGRPTISVSFFFAVGSHKPRSCPFGLSGEDYDITIPKGEIIGYYEDRIAAAREASGPFLNYSI